MVFLSENKFAKVRFICALDFQITRPSLFLKIGLKKYVTGEKDIFQGLVESLRLNLSKK